jgi:transposase
MRISRQQYESIAHLFPVQRGNVRIDNCLMLNAILYVAENGCKWRALPTEFGSWHTVYTRFKRWSEAGVIDRVFEALQKGQILRLRVESVCVDSTIVKVHPDGTGALKKRALKPSVNREPDGPPKFIWLPRAIERF